MDKTNDYPKSRTARSPDDMSDPPIDLERGRKANQEAEKRNPKFKAVMDKLRKAAAAVGKGVKMLTLLALTLVARSHVK